MIEPQNNNNINNNIIINNNNTTTTNNNNTNNNNNNNNFEMNQDENQLILNSKQLLEQIKESKKKNPQLKFIRVCWVDISNKIRTKAINIDWILNHEPKLIHVSITDVCMSLLCFEDSVTIGALKSENFGEAFLMPTTTKLNILPYCPSHIQIFGEFFNLDNESKKLKPWSLCPRNSLQRAIDRLKNKFGISLKGSFEEEFYLIKKGDNNSSVTSLLNSIEKLDHGTFANYLPLDCYGEILGKITNALEEQGLPVEQLLSESGSGQFEITIDYTDIMEACDRHIIVRQTINSIASNNGYIATFIPKPFDGLVGSGCHAHLSLWDTNGRNLTPDANGECCISLINQFFIGGLLKHSKSLTALFNPTPNSYKRLKPFCWSGCNISWGVDNKESFIRIPSSPFSVTEGCSNFEIKTIDHTSNPYLAMSGIIHAGFDGIENSIAPPPPTSLFDQSVLNNQLIPSNFEDAIQSLKENHYLCENIGNDISNAFIHIKLAENKILKELSTDDQILKLLELF
ncbi:hypothetical protein ACTFIR_006162 [Dictyostelium discoideum]